MTLKQAQAIAVAKQKTGHDQKRWWPMIGKRCTSSMLAIMPSSPCITREMAIEAIIPIATALTHATSVFDKAVQ